VSIVVVLVILELFHHHYVVVGFHFPMVTCYFLTLLLRTACWLASLVTLDVYAGTTVVSFGSVRLLSGDILVLLRWAKLVNVLIQHFLQLLLALRQILLSHLPTARDLVLVDAPGGSLSVYYTIVHYVEVGVLDLHIRLFLSNLLLLFQPILTKRILTITHLLTRRLQMMSACLCQCIRLFPIIFSIMKKLEVVVMLCVRVMVLYCLLVYLGNYLNLAAVFLLVQA